MKKSLLTFVTTLSFCISVFAGTGMYVKLKNGEVAKYKVDDVEEVVFDELQEADSLLKYNILSDSTVSVECGIKPEKLTGDVVIPSKVEIDGKVYNVTRIESSSFDSCYNMTNITIPASINSIGMEAFGGCLGLTNVEIPYGVTSIDFNTFAYCRYLTKITIPSSITSIRNEAFNNCFNLRNIEIPSNVTEIGDKAFFWCESLDIIINNIPQNVTVGTDAFYKCKSVTWRGAEITLDKEETGLQFEVSGSNATVVKGDYSKLESVIIPSKVKINDKVYAVAGIANNAFINCKSLSEVIIYKGITSIGNSAFSGCENLTSVTLSEGIEKIGNSAFEGCSKLKNINLPATVAYIGEMAFDGCASLSKIDIPASVTTIVDYAFSICEKLVSINVDDNNPNYSSVDGVLYDKKKTTLIQAPGYLQGKHTIPSSVTNIANGAFYYCKRLTDLVIPSSVTNISEFAFENCTGLTNVTIPSSVKNIDTKAFSGCKNLDLVISNAKENVTIESGALDDCKSVTWDFLVDESESPLKFKILTDSTAEVTEKNSVTGSVTIPSKVKIDGKIYNVVSIGDYAFKNCKDLTGITIPSCVVKIGTGAFASSGLTSIEIPSSVTSISLSMLSGCSGLANVKIPSSIKSIGENAFVDCTSLTSLQLPSSVKSIGIMAFYGCKNLDLVIDNSEDNVEVAVQAFQNCKSVTWKK
ncbi:MAG: leucine-rich repeat domain-containing protein [Bacteroidales bacterium]|nr:leucine-rich repeat domain-containing protein [Bacteroidales bacterium]